MIDVVTTYHVYPSDCDNDYRYTLSNYISEVGCKGLEINYEEKNSDGRFEQKSCISFGLEDAPVIHKLIGKLLTDGY
ncbi:MAG: hypothetical protein IM613_12475 [Cytophagales bacterium]|nr:hypothetical protein [Cytophagales bacterium]